MPLSFSRTTRRLLTIALALVSLSALLLPWRDLPEHTTVSYFINLLNIDLEYTIPSWFSGLLLAYASLLLWTIGSQKLLHNTEKWEWMTLSGIFLYLSADEMTAIHEVIMLSLRKNLPLEHLSFSVTWMLFGIPLVLIVALIFEKFLRKLPAEVRRHFLFCGAIYVTGALGFEIIGSIYHTPDRTPLYETLVHIEELLEMLGVILFIDGLTKYIHKEYGKNLQIFSR